MRTLFNTSGHKKAKALPPKTWTGLTIIPQTTTHGAIHIQVFDEADIAALKSKKRLGPILKKMLE